MSVTTCRDQPVLDVVIGCDCDPDRPVIGGVRYDCREPLVWRGVREGIPRAREIANACRDDLGQAIRITWCVRADAQMAELYGDAAWPYGEFAELWRELEACGDEIAWHPHLWRWDDQSGCWYQEIEDAEWIRTCLREGHQALSEQLGRPPLTSRMGWEFHNNVTMQEIAHLGIRVDFSAIPGRYTVGSADRWGSKFNCHVDWRGAPEHPYVPDPADYRRPTRDASGSSLIEVPMAVFHSIPLGIVAFGRSLLKARGRGLGRRLLTAPEVITAPLKAYITASPYLFQRLGAKKLQEARRDGQAVLVTAFHPDELLTDSQGTAGPSSVTTFAHNLRWLCEAADHSKIALRFINACEFGTREEGTGNVEEPTGGGCEERGISAGAGAV